MPDRIDSNQGDTPPDRSTPINILAAARPDEMLANLEALLPFEDGQVELRAVGVTNLKGGTFSRQYDRMDLASLVDQAIQLSGLARAVYFTINPVRRGVGRPAKDEDIARRLLLLIDCDPTRPADVSATDAEKAHATRLADVAEGYLADLSWPAPARTDSGNGAHRLYVVDLPNDDETRELVRSFLRALARRLDDADATIDTSVYNASRICKLYGTVTRKGPDTPERPHRASRVLKIPEGFGRTCVTAAMLEAVVALNPLAEAVKPPEPTTSSRSCPAGEGRLSVEERAIRYLAKCEPSISGSRGHDKAFKAACKVGPGFDLPAGEAYRLLRDHFNPRCLPLWSDKELWHKVEDAYEKETRRGWLLEAERQPRDTPTAGNGDGVDPPGDGEAAGAGDALPRILIGTDESRVNDQAVRALAAEPNLYTRDGNLVIVRREQRENRLVNRPDKSPWIAVLPRPTLREMMSRTARWVKRRPKSVPAHPPDWAVAAVADRGEWKGLRHLEGVIEAPCLLADGTVLDTPGYDARSGLLYEPSGDFPPIPGEISQDDARAAAGELLDLVADFPFAVMADDCGASHRAAWLAALLTPLARHSINGACPLFLADANVAGSGKSKSVDIIATLLTGRDAPRTAFPERHEELQKLVFTVARDADPMILFDNLANASDLGGPVLDMMLTATLTKNRILGVHETGGAVPCLTVWYATGNNLGIKGDLLRRIVPFRFDSPHERPEERTDFRVRDLLGHVREHRGRLVVAALKILRGYFLAGRPKANLVPMDFLAWSDVVRQAVYWAIEVDPCATRGERIAADPRAHQARAILAGWAELPNADRGLTAAESRRILLNPDFQYRFGTIRDVFAEWTRDDKLPSPVVIGKRFKAIEGRVLDGKALRGSPYQGTIRWTVVEASNTALCGGGEGGGGSYIATQVKSSGEKSEYLPLHSATTPTTSTTPTECGNESTHPGGLQEVIEWRG